MRTDKLAESLQNNQTVYLYDDYEEAVFKLIPTEGKTIAFAKFKGEKEYQLDQSTKLVYEAKMGGEIVDKEFYENF